jgi:hypothetical protein
MSDSCCRSLWIVISKWVVLLGFIVFYPESEGDGVGRTAPLSLATELVVCSRCVLLYP